MYKFKKKKKRKEKAGIKFVAAGSRYKGNSNSSAHGLLLLGKDWIIHADLPELVAKGGAYRMPHEIIITDQKPDLVLISHEGKQMILIEVTSPNCENLEYWRQKKRDRYAAFKSNIAVGRQCHIFTLEVSSRGFVLASSFFELMSALGIQGMKKKKLRDTLSKTALRCSYIIFINQFNEQMRKSPITPCDIPSNLLLSRTVKNIQLEETTIAKSSFVRNHPPATARRMILFLKHMTILQLWN